MDADEQERSDAAALRCEAARTLLSACGDGEATATTALADHLAGCAECRRFELELARLARQLGAWRAAPAADEAARLATIEARLLRAAVDGDAAAAPPALRRLAGNAIAWRIAASVVGAAFVALPAWWQQRSREQAAPRAAESAAWLAPLTGAALLPGDAPLAAWRPVVAAALETAPEAAPDAENGGGRR